VVLIILSLRQGAVKKIATQNIAKDPADNADDQNKSLPPLGVPINEFLIKKGYLKVTDLEKSFLKALDFLRSSLNVPNYKYRLPWYLLIGAEQSGKTGLMEGSNLNLPVGVPNMNNSKLSDCKWWFLNRGVILDIKGSFLINARGTGANEKGWRSLLICLSRYRSARPINGIILTISAEELYGKYRLSLEEINDRANFLAHKLQTAQNNLGLRLPVYVVITKSDVIPGFQSMCAEVPANNRQNMFGWSSSYNPATIFSVKWIEEAFSTILNNLGKLRMEILASKKPKETRDGVFVLPVEIATLKERLSVYLENIFKTDTYQEKPILRGIYFVGDSGIDQFKTFEFDHIAENTNAPSSKSIETRDMIAPDRRKIFFIDDLISEKIFFEAGICKPLPGRVISINKAVNLAKIGTISFAIIGSIGLYNAYERFIEQRSYMMPVLKKMNTLLYEMQKIQINTPGQSTMVFDTYAREFIDMMNHMENTSFFSIFVPASWFSPLRRDMNETLRISYQQIIIKTIYTDLIIKARTLLNLRPTANDRSDSIAHLMKPTTGAEWALVKGFVTDLSKLENMIYKFNNLKTSSNARDLDELVEYTFNARLPQEFISNYATVHNLIENMPFPAIDLTPYQNMARETLGILYQNYLTAMFDIESPHSLPGRINDFLKNLSNTLNRRAPDIHAFRKFSVELASGRHNLGEPGETWMDQDVFYPGREYDEFFDMLDTNNRLFGKEVSQFLIDQTAIGFENLKSQLKVLNLTLVGFNASMPVAPMKKQKIEHKYSQGIIELADALEALFSEAYMAEAPATRFTYQIPEGRMLRWDANMIDLAYEMAKSFDDFLSRHINNFPRTLQENLLLMARESLQANIVNLISRAQNFVTEPTNMADRLRSEEILSSMIGDVTNVGPKFIKLLELMNQGTVGFSFTELRSLLGNSYFWLLNQLERLQNTMSPYSVKDLTFNWWDGRANAAFSGFAVRDQADLESYMGVQRAQMARMVGYAEPIISFLGAQVMLDAAGDKALLSKWRRIAEQFRAGEAKQADSSFSQLEEFILKTMNTYTAENVPEKIKLSDLRQQSGDFFRERIRILQKGFLGRAEIIKRQSGAKNYETLMQLFNNRIKGNFPFVPEAQSTGTEPEVTPDVLREFFMRYNEFGGSPDKILDQIYQLGAPADAAVSFLQDMHRFRQMIEPFVTGAASSIVFDIAPRFRTHRSQSSQVERVSDMYIRIGQHTVTSADKNPMMRWRHGMPIEFGFKFPAGRDLTPVQSASKQNYVVRGNTAIFTFSTPWALFKALKALNTKGMASPNGAFVLAFDIPTTGAEVKIHHSLEVMTPPSTPKGVGQPVTLPEFPIEAPALSDEVKSHLEQAALANGLVEPAEYKEKAADQIPGAPLPQMDMQEYASGDPQVPADDVNVETNTSAPAPAENSEKQPESSAPKNPEANKAQDLMEKAKESLSGGESGGGILDALGLGGKDDAASAADAAQATDATPPAEEGGGGVMDSIKSALGF
ncbi:MAG: type VI secretion system protein, partial [Alphaproteobacteria bacterium]|nr:type VI secretion system protein [Alphaproteobacteria bacterium]